MAKLQSKILTDTQLRRLVSKGTPVAVSDGDGLTFTLSEAGTAAWILRYRFGGRRRELTLGRYPDISLQIARRRAAVERVRIADGIDVAADKRRNKATSVTACTVRQLVEDYKAKTLAQAAASTRKLYSGYANNWVMPHLGAMLVRDVAPADVVGMLRACSTRGSGAMRTLHAVTRNVFDHACGQAIRADNPAVPIKRSTILPMPARRKGHALGGAELAKFLQAIPNDAKGRALRLHLLTGVRPAELCEARWSEFDLEAETWTIPEERSKTSSAYTITLPDQAMMLLRAIRADAGESTCLFPASRGRDRPIPYQTYRAWLWRVLDELGVARKLVKPHDLRRTMRSGLTTLGVRYEVAERAINHKLPGLTELYDRNDYAQERAVALQQWADYLDTLEQGGNVVPIKRKAGKESGTRR